MQTQSETKDYKGYDLFLDVEDKDLRTRNRAVCLFNIFEDNSKDGLLTPRGTADMVGYVKALPVEERADTVARLSLMMDNVGYA